MDIRPRKDATRARRASVRSRQGRLALLCALLGSSYVVSAQAPDPDSTPVFDSIQWPVADATRSIIQVQTGGGIDAHFDTDLPGACDGDVTRRPGVHLDVTEPGGIVFAARSQSRTRPTLLVHAPDGRWHCDHGNYGRRSPAVRIDHTLTGRYAIWVGAYESPDGDAELVIEQLPAG